MTPPLHPVQPSYQSVTPFRRTKGTKILYKIWGKIVILLQPLAYFFLYRPSKGWKPILRLNLRRWILNWMVKDTLNEIYYFYITFVMNQHSLSLYIYIVAVENMYSKNPTINFQLKISNTLNLQAA